MSEPFDWCVPLLPPRSDLLVTNATAVTGRVNGLKPPSDKGREANARLPAVAAVTGDVQLSVFGAGSSLPTHTGQPAVTGITTVTGIPERFECIMRCRKAWAVLTPSDERSEQWNDIGVTAFSMAEMAVIATMTKGQVMSDKIWDALVAIKKIFPAARLVEK
jgi:hypothetical protein